MYRIYPILLILIIIPSCTTVTDSLSSMQYKILYQSEGSIDIINPDGSRKQTLIDTTEQSEFGWVGNQKKIYNNAYNSNDFTYDITTGRIDYVTDIWISSFPKWSPDGLKIAYTYNGNIYAGVFETQDYKILTNDAYFKDFIWSPDGTKIAYTYILYINSTYLGKIFIVDTDGLLINTIDLFDNVIIRLFGWHPDESRLLFSSSASPNQDVQDIFSVNIDGNELIQLTNTDFEDSYPQYSPDGKTIVFNSTRFDYIWKIYLMNNDGTNQTPISNGTNPKWSPDGSYISVQKSSDILIINPEGKEISRFRGGYPKWSKIKF